MIPLSIVSLVNIFKVSLSQCFKDGQGRIVQETHRPRDASSKGRIVQGIHRPGAASSKDFSFKDTPVGDEITLHPKH